MKSIVLMMGVVLLSPCNSAADDKPDRSDKPSTVNGEEARSPIGQPGTAARYVLQKQTDVVGSVVTAYTVALGPVESRDGVSHQWFRLDATKADGEQFSLWLLSAAYPPETIAEARAAVARYILQEGNEEPREFLHEVTRRAVLPSLGGWRDLIPRAAGPTSGPAPVFPDVAQYLGHSYRLDRREPAGPIAGPSPCQAIRLRPDLLIGLPRNARQKDETRRFDDSDYELVPLVRADFDEMIEAGLTCLRVDAGQVAWVDSSDVYHFGGGTADVPYPECLYRSHYLGPTLYLDEPAVVTRDHVIRPRLARDESFRQALTPQIALDAFKKHFRHVNHEGAPAQLLKGLASRPDVDLGQMQFLQKNIYSWETMVSSAAYELSDHPDSPCAIVFEPPGRIGTRRTLPEMNMTYGCQIAVDDPKFFIDIICGFLRGAARLTNKEWGISIYGQVDRADAYWYLTHAYDLGATHFFYWNTHRLACVPHGECLAMSKNLRRHASSRPHRDLDKLKRAAEIVILLPPGYNLGHVAMGKGSLWGVGELNLERVNRRGVKYRVVMRNFFLEIERCLRLGVAFDLLWDLPGIRPAGYREVVRVREDGTVVVEHGQEQTVLDRARTPVRPEGDPPRLTVHLSDSKGDAPLSVTARADVVEGASLVYYTLGADHQGIYRNAMVAWELFGPGDADYRFLQPDALKPSVVARDDGGEVATQFTIDRPGTYRLRAATVDMAGRTAVVWKEIVVSE